MGTVPAPLARVIQELVKLPGVGEKTATRLAFHLSRAERRDVDALAAALRDLREQLRTCSVCCALAGSDPCELCSDPRRNASRVRLYFTMISGLAMVCPFACRRA